MKIKRCEKIIGSILILAVIMLLIIPFASAEVSFCCEKTKAGGWCLPDKQENCDPAFKITPTSCDSTSYCKRGCCFDAENGLCMDSTPQRTCEDSGGAWKDSAQCNIPQCELGCCILGDQAALVTMTRCLSLSSEYSVETNFRADITNELECINTANAQDRGACVYDDPQMHVPTCKFTTRGECNAQEGELGQNATGKSFYKDILCSAKALGTRCVKSKLTMTIEGRDEIYYKDLCNNPANIYDASKYDDEEYWTRVYTKDESCNPGESNAGSRVCGNCNYFLGSMARATTISTGKPTYGSYICIDLSCNGHKHGESWCAYDSSAIGNGKDKVGSRYYKEICLNNEILTEPCHDFRNEICLQDETNGFSEAACVVNRWQDCIQQDEKKDCVNTDQRDCRWISGYYFASAKSGVQFQPSNGDSVDGLCLPEYPPGFDFYGESTAKSAESVAEGTQAFAGSGGNEFGATTTSAAKSIAAVPTTSAADVCGIASTALTVNFERDVKAFGDKSDWECKGVVNSSDGSMDNNICQYFTKDEMTNPDGWATDMNKICTGIGDCGWKANWVDKKTDDGFAVYFKSDRMLGGGGGDVLNEDEDAASKTTGNVILGFLKDTYGKISK